MMCMEDAVPGDGTWIDKDVCQQDNGRTTSGYRNGKIGNKESLRTSNRRRDVTSDLSIVT